MRIPIKKEMQAIVKKIQKEGDETKADFLFDPLLSLILEYVEITLHHVKDDSDKKQVETQKKQNKTNRYTFQPRLTLLGNLNASYATQIAHNLLWHIDIDKTLEFAKANPSSLLVVVEIKDPHGQRVRGTPLRIVAAAGDRNPIDFTAIHHYRQNAQVNDYGLVERLRSCFPEKSNDYYKQLKDWFSRDLNKIETIKTMRPYIKAIDILFREIVSTEISEDTDFETLLSLPWAEEFRNALTPDPEHVVTAGFLFDLQIFIDFFKIWDENIINDEAEDKQHPNLGYRDSIKSELFAFIVFPALQARVQRIDLEIFHNGIANVGFKGNPHPSCAVVYVA